MADGSTMNWRKVSSSADKSPVIDIDIERSNDHGELVTLKIHLRRDRDMVNIDVRLENEDIQILQVVVGKTLDWIEHDEFVFTNTSLQAGLF